MIKKESLEIGKEDLIKLKAEDRKLAKEILEIYSRCSVSKKMVKDIDRLLLFIFYNIYNLGLEKKAFLILEDLKSDYFSTSLIKDMHAAVSYSKTFSRYYKQSDARVAGMKDKCKYELEFFVVAVRSIIILSSANHFKHIDDFNKLMDRLESERFDLPEILTID